MRKRAHEEHANHEAWAIPYGDLVTLLLALFVVLYSMSSVNEGKYRVLSDSLNEAFGGAPRSATPIQIGDNTPRSPAPAVKERTPRPVAPVKVALPGGERDIRRMADEVQRAMADLIDRQQVTVRANGLTLEIEIRADILFPSGVAEVSLAARPVLARVSSILKGFPNEVRVEGHTDNLPIATRAFPSNWQLSSARAASVVALFMAEGLAPQRMSVAGFGEYQPKAGNDTADGRNQNRRVLIVVLGTPEPAPPAQVVATAEPALPPAPPERAAANALPADAAPAAAATISAMPTYSDEEAAVDEMVGTLIESESLPPGDAAAH
jgi:chemotaxis protein MotB